MFALYDANAGGAPSPLLCSLLELTLNFQPTPAPADVKQATLPTQVAAALEPLETFWPACAYSPSEHQGVISFMGFLNGRWQNPASSNMIAVTVSTAHRGLHPHLVLEREGLPSEIYVDGDNSNPAWVQLDFGGWLLQPTGYRFQSPHPSEYMRSWSLQARLDDESWVTLSTHQTDVLQHARDVFSSQLSSTSQFNCFRILMTGPNSEGPEKGGSPGNHRMRLHGLELFGQLARRPGAPLRAAAQLDVAVNNEPQWLANLYQLVNILDYFHSLDASHLDQQYRPLLEGVSRGILIELIVLANDWSTKHEGFAPEAEDLDLSAAGKKGYVQLENGNLDQKQLRRALQGLLLFNRLVMKCLPFLDLGLPRGSSPLTDAVRSSSELILLNTKNNFWTATLAQSVVSTNNPPTIVVDIMKAAAFQETGFFDESATELCWGQSFTQLRQQKSSIYCLPFGSRAFKCDYKGLRSIDAGGPYRDVLERMSQDLVSPSCNLFLKTPNQIAHLGENRNCFIPNPAATSNLQLAQFEFLGKLLGLSLRTRTLFNVPVPPLIWNALVDRPITMADIESVDVLSANTLKAVQSEQKNMPVELYNTEMSEIKFTAMGSDSKVHEICPDGSKKSLTFENREEYAKFMFKFRANEFHQQTAAIRRGLGKVVPLSLLSLFSGRELEMMVCGHGFSADAVKLLQNNTEYKAYSADDQHIRWFWDILEHDFNDEQRSQYLTFVWGRSRLPATAAELETQHKINSHNGGNSSFPMAHTCFFTIDLPRYTDRAVMAQRLLTAITMCGVIDGD
jgi:hypothetical protein